MTCIDKESKKIGGFDKWEVESAARTLIEAQEIKAKPKFFAVVQAECDRQAEAALKAANEKKVAATEIKVAAKLKKVFK